MKKRNGFVSNSSSSSFLIIGVTRSGLIEKLVSKDKPNEGGYGSSEGKVVKYYGASDSEDGFEYAGIDAEKLLETHTIPQIKKMFIEKVKSELDIDIPENAVKMHYGEASSE